MTATETQTIAAGVYRNGKFGVNSFTLVRKDGGFIAGDCYRDGVWFGSDYRAAKDYFMRIARDHIEGGRPVAITTRPNDAFRGADYVRGLV